MGEQIIFQEIIIKEMRLKLTFCGEGTHVSMSVTLFKIPKCFNVFDKQKCTLCPSYKKMLKIKKLCYVFIIITFL